MRSAPQRVPLAALAVLRGYPLLAAPQTRALPGTALPGSREPAARPPGPHTMPGSSPRPGRARGLRAPRTGRGVRGDEFVEKCFSRPSPATGGRGQATVPLAFCCPSSTLLRRAGSLRGRVPASFCRGSLAVGLRLPPLPSASRRRASAGVGRGGGAHSWARTAARPPCPRCRRSPCGCRGRRCAQVRGLPLAPSLPDRSRCPGIMRP